MHKPPPNNINEKKLLKHFIIVKKNFYICIPQYDTYYILTRQTFLLTIYEYIFRTPPPSLSAPPLPPPRGK